MSRLVIPSQWPAGQPSVNSRGPRREPGGQARSTRPATGNCAADAPHRRMHEIVGHRARRRPRRAGLGAARVRRRAVPGIRTTPRDAASITASQAPLAQLAEQRTLNPRVRGSSPWRRTRSDLSNLFQSALHWPPAWNGSWNEWRISRYRGGMPRAGTGHIERLPSGSYRVHIYAGTDPLTGRQLRHRQTAKTEERPRIVLGSALGAGGHRAAAGVRGHPASRWTYASAALFASRRIWSTSASRSAARASACLSPSSLAAAPRHLGSHGRSRRPSTTRSSGRNTAATAAPGAAR
jgi:hypothetical protein